MNRLLFERFFSPYQMSKTDSESIQWKLILCTILVHFEKRRLSLSLSLFKLLITHKVWSTPFSYFSTQSPLRFRYLSNRWKHGSKKFLIGKCLLGFGPFISWRTVHPLFQSRVHSLRLMIIGNIFRYPPCTNVTVSKLRGNNIIKSWPWNLRKVRRQLENRKALRSLRAFHEPFHSLFRQCLGYKFTPLSVLIVNNVRHVLLWIFRNIVVRDRRHSQRCSVNITRPATNFCCIMPSGQKKTDCRTRFILGGRFSRVEKVTRFVTRRQLIKKRLRNCVYNAARPIC